MAAKKKRASGRRATKAGRFAGDGANESEIARLAEAANEKNKKKGGANAGEVSDDTIKMHLGLIEAARTDHKKKRDIAVKANQFYRSRLDVAKKDGVDTDALVYAFKVADRSVNEFASEHRNVGRYLRLMGAPVADPQLKLFAFLDEPEPEGEPRLKGEAAGKSGAPRDENPHTPGTDAFQLWETGWQVGVDTAQEALSKGTSGGAKPN